MHFQNNKQHMIDILFMLSLFCVFAFCSVVLIIFGADIYQNTVNKTNSNYLERTSVAYLTEKLRQTDISQEISITNIEDTDVLTLETEVNGTMYATRLYEYDGYLYECFSRSDIELPLDAGQAIFEMTGLTFTLETSTLLKISFDNDKQENISFYINLNSDNT